MTKPLNVAVAGATGAVGEELLRLLVERKFPLASVRLLASSRSTGRKIPFLGEELPVAEMKEDSFEGVDLAFFSCGAERSRRFIPAAVRAGAIAVDNSSAFRMQEGVPLVVPEINADTVADHRGVLAVPNCTTIVFLMAVAPLHREARLVRAVVSSYQAASGAGRAALGEYDDQVRRTASGEALESAAFPRVLHGNVIPQVDAFLPDGSTKEERKLEDETRKILGDPGIAVAATCVRVPVRRAHAVSAALQFEKPLPPKRAREILRDCPGVILFERTIVDGRESFGYPTPLDVTGRLEVFVGRLRADTTVGNGLLLWSVGDQLLKGAAWNALQIAESLIGRSLI